MVVHNSLHTGSATGYVQAVDARLSMSGELAVDGNGPTPALGVRLGVMYAPGNPFLVVGNSSTSPWQFLVAAGTAVTSKGALDGPHLVTNDAPLLVSTIAPPSSNSRYDVVYVQQQDSAATISPDASTAAIVGVVNGTAGAVPAVPAVPSAPNGSVAIAVALVDSTATNGTSGSGVTITTSGTVGSSPLIAPYTVARGAPIPCRTLAERAALTRYIGLTVYRLDLRIIQLCFDGAAWVDVASLDSMGNTGSAISNILVPPSSGGSQPMLTKTGMYHGYTFAQNGNEYAGTVTFDVAFPNYCTSLSIMQIQAGTATAREPHAVDFVSSQQFRVLYPGGTAATDRAFMWTAIGY